METFSLAKCHDQTQHVKHMFKSASACVGCDSLSLIYIIYIHFNKIIPNIRLIICTPDQYERLSFELSHGSGMYLSRPRSSTNEM